MPDVDPPFIIMLSLADTSVCACVSALTSFTYSPFYSRRDDDKPSNLSQRNPVASLEME